MYGYGSPKYPFFIVIPHPPYQYENSFYCYCIYHRCSLECAVFIDEAKIARYIWTLHFLTISDLSPWMRVILFLLPYQNWHAKWFWQEWLHERYFSFVDNYVTLVNFVRLTSYRQIYNVGHMFYHRKRCICALNYSYWLSWCRGFMGSRYLLDAVLKNTKTFEQNAVHLHLAARGNAQ